MSLSENPSAVDLLENHQDKINWNSLSTNEGIFESRDNPVLKGGKKRIRSRSKRIRRRKSKTKRSKRKSRRH